MPHDASDDRSRSAGTCSAPRHREVVAEARAVGDAAAVRRDQVRPLHRPAREVARRQIVDRIWQQRREQEPIGPCRDEQQPARGPIAATTSRRLRARVMPARLAISAAWVICTPCGWRVLPEENWMSQVSAGAERPEIDRLLGQRLDGQHAAVQADRGKLPRRHRRGSPARSSTPTAATAHRGGELAAQLVEIGFLAADPDRIDTGTGSRPACWAPKKASKKPGQVSAMISSRSPTAEASADQLAGDDMGALADLAPRQGRKLLTPRIIEGARPLPGPHSRAFPAPSRRPRGTRQAWGWLWGAGS